MGDEATAAVGDQIQRARRGRRAAEQGEEDSGEPWFGHFGTSRAQLVEPWSRGDFPSSIYSIL
jgi:hypothetical protein